MPHITGEIRCARTGPGADPAPPGSRRRRWCWGRACPHGRGGLPRQGHGLGPPGHPTRGEPLLRPRAVDPTQEGVRLRRPGDREGLGALGHAELLCRSATPLSAASRPPPVGRLCGIHAGGLGKMPVPGGGPAEEHALGSAEDQDGEQHGRHAPTRQCSAGHDAHQQDPEDEGASGRLSSVTTAPTNHQRPRPRVATHAGDLVGPTSAAMTPRSSAKSTTAVVSIRRGRSAVSHLCTRGGERG